MAFGAGVLPPGVGRGCLGRPPPAGPGGESRPRPAGGSPRGKEGSFGVGRAWRKCGCVPHGAGHRFNIKPNKLL